MAVDFKVECAFGHSATTTHTRTNLSPGGGSFAGGVTTGYSFNNPTHYSRTVSNTGGVDGREFVRIVRAVGGLASAPFFYMATPGVAAVPLQTFTASFYVRPVGTPRKLNVRIYSRTSGGVLTIASMVNYDAPPAGVWTRITQTGTLLADAATVMVYVHPVTGDDWTEAVDGYDVDHMLIESGDVVPCEYFEGTITLPGPAASAWTDISEYVTGLDVDRGRNNEFDEIETGVLNLKLDNSDGRFTPERPPSVLRVNRSFNPDFESGSLNGIVTNDAALYTFTSDTTAPISGGRSAMSTRAASPLSAAVTSAYHAPELVSSTNTKVTPGQPVRVSFDVRTEQANRYIQTYLVFRNAVPSVIGNYGDNSVTLTSGVVTRVGAEAIAPAGADSVLAVFVVRATIGNAVAGERVWFDNFLTEDASDVRPYFGPSTAGAAWQGTAYNSRINLSQTDVYYPNVVPGVPVRVTASNDAWESCSHIFAGTIEKWPVTLSGVAECSPSATDTFGTLASEVAEPLRQTIVAMNPMEYRPLNAVTGWADIVSTAWGNNVVTSKNGSTAETFGEFEGKRWFGDGGQGLTIENTSNAFGKVLVHDNLPVGAIPWTASWAFLWRPNATVGIAAAPIQTLWAVEAYGLDMPTIELRTVANPSGPGVRLQLFYAYRDGVSFAFSAATTRYIQSGEPVGIVTRTDLNDPFNPYVGFTVVYTDGTTETKGAADASPWGDVKRVVFLGDEYVQGTFASGTFAHYAMFATTVDALTLWGPWLAATNSNDVQAVRDVVSWLIPGDVVDAPASTYGAARAPLDWAGNRTAIEVVKEIAAETGGVIYALRNGRIAFRDRFRRALGNVSEATFSGTLAPEDEALSLYVDESKTINDVTVSGASGVASRATDEASVTRYGRKSVTVETGLTNGTEVQGAAEYRLWLSATPRVRVEGVKFNLTAFPDVALLLRLDIGSRVTLALPAAAPWASADYYVEGISVDVSIDGGTPEASLSVRLSPAIPYEGWLLEDSVNGALGTSTRLMY